jgi:hypothetical protein
MAREAAGDSVLLTTPIDQSESRGILSAPFDKNVRVIAVLPRTWEAGEAPDV